jgi:hypothetical protein
VVLSRRGPSNFFEKPHLVVGADRCVSSRCPVELQLIYCYNTFWDAGWLTDRSRQILVVPSNRQNYGATDPGNVLLNYGSSLSEAETRICLSQTQVCILDSAFSLEMKMTALAYLRCNGAVPPNGSVGSPGSLERQIFQGENAGKPARDFTASDLR